MSEAELEDRAVTAAEQTLARRGPVRGQILLTPETVRLIARAALGVQQDACKQAYEDGLAENERLRNWQLQERFEAGQQDVHDKYERLHEVLAVLKEARAIVDACRSWTGRPDWREHTLTRIDDLMRDLKP